jgi:hypothetical protein
LPNKGSLIHTVNIETWDTLWVQREARDIGNSTRLLSKKNSGIVHTLKANLATLFFHRISNFSRENKLISLGKTKNPWENGVLKLALRTSLGTPFSQGIPIFSKKNELIFLERKIEIPWKNWVSKLALMRDRIVMAKI